MSGGGGAWSSGGASNGRGVFLGPAGTGGNRLATGARQVRTQVTRGPAPQRTPSFSGLQRRLTLNPTSQRPPARAPTPSVCRVCQSRALSRAPPQIRGTTRAAPGTPECKPSRIPEQALHHSNPEAPAQGDLALTSPCPSQRSILEPFSKPSNVQIQGVPHVATLDPRSGPGSPQPTLKSGLSFPTPTKTTHPEEAPHPTVICPQ